ncbi:O-antigen ligase [Pseudarthrobacter oxydans]|uniref:O-antigen ligase family protein n=1 Tax=Pseudarthrobacter oxydans TaxID=1671 RepID=UPI002780384F|nr:O-antigen ligase family protein [Pseudarthrobacter oxydans]MDP9980807.1 O-antigen ligase [Pseudarthrobacter oxydans]
MRRHADPRSSKLFTVDAHGPERDRTGWDAVNVLIIYFLILLVVPSNRAIEALGGAGAPAALFALVFLPWWGWYHLQRTARMPADRIQPVRIAMFILLGCIMASYAAGALRAMTPTESNALNLGLVRTAAFASVLLLASDGIPTRERLIRFLHWCCLLGGMYAALGILQFFTGQSFVANLTIPGLSVSDFGALQERGGFNRPSATARNPLECAFVLSMLFPVAISLALHDRGRHVFLRWFPVAAMAITLMLSVSRSAIIGLFVAVAVLFPFWSPQVRRRAGIAALSLLVMVGAVIPGMMGTLLGLFGGEDASLKSRTDSYDVVWIFWQMNPVFGRGLGTFLPEYRILDNQFLVSLLDTGAVGLAAFIAVPVTAFVVALIARKRYSDQLFVHLGPGLAAGVAAGTSLTGFFDALSFPQAAGCLFLLTGVCGAYWRLRDKQSMSPPDRPRLRSSSRGVDITQWAVAPIVLLLMAPLIVAASQSKGVYSAKQDVVFLPPPGAAAGNPLRLDSEDIVQFAAVIERRAIARSSEPQLKTNGASLYTTGVREGYSVYLPNAGSQWEPSFNKAVVKVEAVADDPVTAEKIVAGLAGKLEAAAAQEQDTLGVSRSAHITTERSPSATAVSYHASSPAAAAMALVVLAVGLGAGAAAAHRVFRDTARRRQIRG